MKKIRWGIIGCGDVTEIKSGPAFQKAEGSELVAVMRRNGNLAGDYAKRHNVPKWYDDADKLINDLDVDAVYIATPPSTHKKYTIETAKAGKPVYVEKPMAISYKECLEMIEACRRLNVPLFTAYYRRAMPHFRKIKELIDDKTIGQVRTINIQFNQKPSEKDLIGQMGWRVNPAISGCGYFCDLASHMLDFLIFTFGKITDARGIVSNKAKLYKAEDTVTALFQFENGMHGVGHWCFCANENLDRTEIVGSKGKIIYSSFDVSPIILQCSDKREEFSISNPEHVQQPLIQLIVNELLGRGESPSNGITGAETSRIMDLILNRI